MIMFSLHIPSIKNTNNQYYTQWLLTLGKDLGKNLGKNLGNNYTNKTYNYRIIILLWFVLGIFREYLPRSHPRSKLMFHPKREMSDILGNESHQCRIGIDLGYNYTNKTYNYRLFILLGFVLGIFREYLAEVLVGGYTMIMFSLFILHLSRVKTYNQYYRMTLGWDLGKNLGRELYKQNIQPSIIYSFWVCFRNISNPSGAYAPSGFRYPGQSPCISRVITKVLAEVSAGGYTISILVFLFFIYQE